MSENVTDMEQSQKKLVLTRSAASLNTAAFIFLWGIFSTQTLIKKTD